WRYAPDCGLRGRARAARREASNGKRGRARIKRRRRVDLQRKPGVDIGLERCELAADYRDDARRLAVHVHNASDNARVRSKLLAPERRADDRHIPIPRLRRIRRERRSEDWPNAER